MGEAKRRALYAARVATEAKQKKRSDAAKKAAATRAANKAATEKRSEAAKKGAATRRARTAQTTTLDAGA